MLLSFLGGHERSFQIVDDREEFANQPTLRSLTGHRGLASGALPVVLEVRLSAAGQIEILVALSLRHRKRIFRRLLLVAECLLLVRRVLLAGGLAPLVT